jgi:hypothetical protein
MAANYICATQISYIAWQALNLRYLHVGNGRPRAPSEEEKMLKALWLATAAVTLSIVAAYADASPPAGAKAVPAATLKAEYAGKTVTWPGQASMYWSPKMTVIGVSAKNDAVADGTWDVVDGKVCYHATWQGIKPTDKPTLMNNCSLYMQVSLSS